MILAGDIGGTKVHLALYQFENGRLTSTRDHKYPAHEFASLDEIVNDFFKDDAETRKLVAATVAAGQVQKLAKQGVDTFHFYTMNRADLVFAISHLLGIRPQGAQKAA